MSIPDYHIHSFLSDDCNTSIDDIISSAKEKGLTSICITDHYDIDFPKGTPCPFLFELDMDSYIRKLNEFKYNYDLRIGVELGIMPTTTAKLKSFYDKYKDQLDFIIASTHIVDNIDPYYPEFFINKTEQEAITQYFETVLSGIKNFHDFSVYGHLDYILRYCPNKDKFFKLDIYYDLIKEILLTIIDNGCGIELNTGSLYRGLDFPHPNKEILKLYYELGGEIITLGSDAHSPNYIAYNFEDQREYLKEIGFKYYSTFKNLKPYYKRL